MKFKIGDRFVGHNHRVFILAELSGKHHQDFDIVVFTEQNVRSIRPADGLPPKYLKDVLGKKAKMDIKKGTPLNMELIS